VTTRALAKADVKEKLAALGMDTAGGSPEQLAATVQAETARWTEVIRKQNIKPE
jgi:tripartite-type tricarboxylate transporter receptor subunit TctC